jgi:hypothetical protein
VVLGLDWRVRILNTTTSVRVRERERERERETERKTERERERGREGGREGGRERVRDGADVGLLDLAAEERDRDTSVRKDYAGCMYASGFTAGGGLLCAGVQEKVRPGGAGGYECGATLPKQRREPQR